MTIHALCGNCNSRHPLKARPVAPGTTTCPDCGAKTYSSERSDADSRSEREKIHSLIKNIDNVGDQTMAAIYNEFGTYQALADADIEELKSVRGVGETVAQRINERAI